MPIAKAEGNYCASVWSLYFSYKTLNILLLLSYLTYIYIYIYIVVYDIYMV